MCPKNTIIEIKTQCTYLKVDWKQPKRELVNWRQIWRDHFKRSTEKQRSERNMRKDEKYGR